MSASRTGFLVRIVLPTVAAVVLFVSALFVLFIPTVERAVMERKREMIRELANVAWSTLERHAQDEREGRLSRAEAQKEALKELRQLRYGPEGKDYYWIIDTTPRMLMHPYVPELEGQDLRSAEDANGKRLFVEQVERSAATGDAYLEYVWQWKDDKSRRTPKLSYVRRYQPWGWIVGTGLYLEDVRREMDRLERHLLGLSAGITLALGALLFYLGLQARRSETRRLMAERNLRESEERHRTLVQASTEGLLLLQEGRKPVINGHLAALLGLADPLPETLEAILRPDPPVASLLPLLLSGPVELRLKGADGAPLDVLVRASREHLGDGEGLVVTVRDISAHRAVSEALDQSREWSRDLAERLDLGVFRATWGKQWRLLEANGATRSLLLAPGLALGEVDLLARLRQRRDADDLQAILGRGEAVKERMVELEGAAGLVNGRLSLIRVQTWEGQDVLEGLFEDASLTVREASRQAHLMEDLQLGQHALYQEIGAFVREAPRLPLEAPAIEAARRLAIAPGGALLVGPVGGEPCGLVTRWDLSDRLLAQGLDPATPLHRIMSSPLVLLPQTALVVEALQALEGGRRSHLVVTDGQGGILGTLRGQELLAITPQAGERILEEILRAAVPEALPGIMERVPTLVRSLRSTGVRGPVLCRYLSALLDAVCQRALAWAEADLGPAPAPFAWVALGSHGRQELSLGSDQDHAMILAEGASPQGYFTELGRHLSRTLALAGWRECAGGVMAGQEAWTADLPHWQRRFSRWIHAAEPRDLLDVHIGFDLRLLGGDPALVEALKVHVRGAVAAHPPFLPMLAQAAQQTKPVLTKLGAIATETDERLDLKNALGRLVNAVRIYALRAGVDAVNTLQRLEALRRRDARMEADHANVAAAFELLTNLRLQAHLDSGQNLADLRRLNEPDRAALKKALAHVDHLNSRLGADFLGRS